ncbi:hypothetical protein B9Q03_05065 [Candidatus Marsarchaeota G2 archaeon OSP_D]|jgi:Predicted Zn-dependent proteases and their inactivated homologs|uniref:TldD/PmbA family protein n=1 Tax=Candidatus Marsarchaeota G2 archaeon OSP_D TaxID=1978157 RepID=A0A2R6AXJ8_9ARCH|nr:MAG: hypothetical protein B9Q03_05065 [Candidatus Marsarchaeota G2 archaeon OSP_D]
MFSFDEGLVDRFSSLVLDSDFGDIRFGRTQSVTIEVNNGEVRSVRRGSAEGFGLRICSGGIWGFGASTSLTQESLAEAVKQAYSMIRASPPARVKRGISVRPVREKRPPDWRVDPRLVDTSDKLGVCLQADSSSRLEGVSSTLSVYGDSVTEWLVGNNQGTCVSYTTSSPRLAVTVYVKDGSTTHVITESIGSNGGFELFSEEATTRVGVEVASKALRLVGAHPVKGGKYDVVLDPAMTGVYIHEAFGHASEADLVMAGASILEGKLGSKVGSELVGVVDDPTISGLRGSYTYDQEGVRATKRVIVERGVLRGYLHTLESAALLDAEPNGAARAMSPLTEPIARMSNTYIAAGDYVEEDIYSDVRLGVAFFGFQYGYVDPGSGKLMFKAQYGRMIRDCELAEYVRDAALTGSTLDVLGRIDALGREVRFTDGTCGKNGQWVPVTTGGPFTRVRGVVVGGQ